MGHPLTHLTGACDRGYYCAWQEFGGKVWCCEDVSAFVLCWSLPRADSCKGSKSGRMRCPAAHELVHDLILDKNWYHVDYLGRLLYNRDWHQHNHHFYQ